MNGMFGMMGAARAHQRAGEAQAAASKSDWSSRRTQNAIRELEDRFERLQLVCQAMWEVLRERTDLSEADLLAKVGEVDLRDGVADGKVTKTVKKCPKCGRTMSPKHQRCLYCGESKLVREAFDAVR